jgi:hypothetical protein
MLQNAQTITLVKTTEAPAHLSEMDLDRDLLLEAVGEGHAARANATELHPPTTAGYNAWTETNFGLSRRLVEQGWSIQFESNIPILRHPTGAYQIVVSSGDVATGTEVESWVPTTLMKKGRKFSSLFGENGRGLFDKDVLTSDLMQKIAGECPTYILLYHYDPLKSETRCELSLPSPTDEAKIANKEKQYVAIWQKQIIIGSVGGQLDLPTANFTDDSDFDITKKASK